MAEPNSQFRKAARIGAAFLVVLGIAVLVGWTADISWLKSILPGRIPMKPNAAIAFLACGWALRLLLRDSVSRLARYASIALSFLVLTIGSLSLFAIWRYVGVGISQLFLPAAQPSRPFHIAPITAPDFLVAGM